MKKLLGITAVLGILITAAAFLLPPVLLRSKPAEKMILREIEKITGASIKFESHRISYFPFLSAQFQNVKVVTKGRRPLTFEAAELRIRLARLPFLLGRIQMAGLDLDKIRWQVPLAVEGGTETLDVHDASLRMGTLAAGKPIKVSFTGALNDNPGVLSAKAVLTFKSLEMLEWKDIAIDAVVNLQDVPLKIFEKTIFKYIRSELLQGVSGGRWTFRKEPGSEIVKAHAEGHVKNFIYRYSGNPDESAAPSIDMVFRYQLNWNPVTEVFNVQTASLTTPIGRVEISGNMFGADEGVQDIRVTASDVVLESIPQYFVTLKDAIPFNIGFSGLSRLEMSISGTWDLLSVNAKLDLTQALLTYARYFSKPKDLPFDVVFDYELKSGSILTGDFSVRFKDMTMKGSLTDLNLANGEGQLNVITNKFQLKEWESFIPLFQDYKLGGDLKLLANFKGDLQKLYETRAMFNFTLENGRVMGPQGKELTDIKMSLDLSPMALEVRDTVFKSGNDTVSGSFRAYNLLLSPITRLSLKSDHVDVANLIANANDLAAPWLSDSVKGMLGEWHQSLLYFSPAGEIWKNFLLELTVEDGRWQVPAWHFDAYQGTVSAQGEGAFAGDTAGSRWDIKADRISLARFGKRLGGEASPIEGNLFLEAHLRAPVKSDASWQDVLEGDGIFLVTNGEFRTFNLMGAVSGIPDFSNVFKAPVGETTLFHDLQSEFRVANRKITAEKLVLLADDFQCEAGGSWTFDGVLNYRMQVFLNSENLVLEKAAESGDLKEEGMLGPVSLLLSGPLDKPELKPDPALIPQVFQQLLTSKRYRALDNFLSEDFFKAPEKA